MTIQSTYGKCIVSLMDSALAFAGETVYYTSKKSGITTPIQAVRTDPNKDETGEEGKRLNANVVVFALYADSLSAFPVAGDSIKDSNEVTYDVLPVDGVLTKYKDPFGLILTVYTKLRDKWAV